MEFKNVRVSNMEGAFRGLRNPMNSWAKSDSQFGIGYCDDLYADMEVAGEWVDKMNPNVSDDERDKAMEEYIDWLLINGDLYHSDNCIEYAYIGPVDMDLAHRMIKAGSSDRKFLRQIFVSVDITAPIYWWKEADTYKVGTVANSTSTMHKLSSIPISLNCFEKDDFVPDLTCGDYEIKDLIQDHIFFLESLRQKYNITKDQRYWKELVRWLPQGWLQTRTWTANYEILCNIYTQRRHHRLTEWHQFCDWIKTLPYANDLILYALDNK